MGNTKTIQKFIISLAFAALFYIGFSVWSDAANVWNALMHFRWIYIVPILILSLLNYALRFIKWEYYLHTLQISIAKKDSLLIYLSGFAMSITPGKLGEVIKSYLLKQRAGIPLSKTAPIVVADRLSDLLALVCIVAVGTISFHYGQWLTLGLLVFIAAGVVCIVYRPAAERIITTIGRLSFAQRHMKSIRNLYESSYVMLQPKRLLFTTLISIVAWGCECLGFFLVFQGFGLGAGVLAACFIYAFSTIVGALSFLPGGIGFTESSMAALLLYFGIAKAQAATATIIIRGATLWFAVIIGIAALLLTQRWFHQSKETPHS